MGSMSFLRSVAEAFVSNAGEDLKDYCFVFPNRRSGVFFQSELAELAKKPFVLPRIITISDLLMELTHCVEAGRIELLLCLYESYKELQKDGMGDSFDRFVYWGDVVLSDFNDVDRYMVDAESLFKNVKDLNDIEANYLTEEQKKIIREYFGETSLSNSKTSLDSFWKTVGGNEEKSSVEKYLKLWEILWPLYQKFNERLTEKGLSYSGAISRKAVEVVKQMTADTSEYVKYVFVGFNVLSASEFAIFKNLQTKHLADFYWDCDSIPLNDEQNKASMFVRVNKRLFKSQLNYENEEIKEYPNIEVYSVPSNIGQAKQVSVLLSQMKKSKVDFSSSHGAAVVLPDESLFLPLITSIPAAIKDVNITMGYPMNSSSVASLIGIVAKMHKQARFVGGVCSYFNEDVKLLFSHPYMQNRMRNEADDLLKKIRINRLFFVPYDMIQESCPSLKCLFEPVSTKNVEGLISYVGNILEFLNTNLPEIFDQDSEHIEQSFVQQYVDNFHQMVAVIKDYNIEMNDDTFFFMVDRFVSISSVALEGEPLLGLQIMGVLETRCLDFDNLIVLSMNEHVFPKKHFTKSFIPNNLRKGFNMATMEYQESIYSYYFYRMICRAKNVYLLYDSRPQGLGCGEPSRYIRQLEQIYLKTKLKRKDVSYSIVAPKELLIKVEKTDRIMNIINQFKNSEFKDEKSFSPSSINMLINCPLQFYLSKVEELRVEDEETEFMSGGDFGTIIHLILEKIYKDAPKAESEGRKVTPDYIENLLNDENRLLRYVREAVNEAYLKKGANCNEELQGEARVLQDTMIFCVKEVLNRDKGQEFIMLKSEEKERSTWKISDDLSINYTQIIDRVDKVGDHVRLVDYKTGGDEHTNFNEVEDLFDSSKDNRCKAVLQVFLYCNFYAYKHHLVDEKIEPQIYKVFKMKDSAIKYNKNVLCDYREANEEFKIEFEKLMRNFFDRNVPFTQAKKTDKCDYCNYKDFCRK